MEKVQVGGDGSGSGLGDAVGSDGVGSADGARDGEGDGVLTGEGAGDGEGDGALAGEGARDGVGDGTLTDVGVDDGDGGAERVTAAGEGLGEGLNEGRPRRPGAPPPYRKARASAAAVSRGRRIFHLCLFHHMRQFLFYAVV